MSHPTPRVGNPLPIHYFSSHPLPREARRAKWGLSPLNPLILLMSSCRLCRSTFVISDADLAFYEKVSPVIGGKTFAIPPPTLCPDCRQQRRMSFRNEHTFYRSTCKCCGRGIVSVLHPNNPTPPYCRDCWFGDSWDAREWGRDFDASRSFFEQLKDLKDVVPEQALSIWNSENSNFCNYVGDVKDCYLIFGPVYSQDCYYGSPYYSKNCVDTLVIRNCERCYECIDSRELYGCSFCQDCHSSSDLLFCADLQGCSECIGCAGLRKKKYCIFNEQLTKEEYEKRKKELNVYDRNISSMLEERLHTLMSDIPHRFMQSNQVEDVSGNYIYQCQRAHDCYYTDKSQDCRYCAQVVDLKDCQDLNFTEENELCYDYLGAYQNNRTSFSLFCNRTQECLYAYACHRSHHLFGCVGMKDASYCILNKQYSKEEYEKLVPKIIEQMRKAEEWGEFFPVSMSSFGYNETVASEYFPLTKEEVLERTWRWQDDLPYTTGRETVGQENIAGDPKNIPDTVTQEILGCVRCRRNYRIIPQELAFYRSQGLPLPEKCFDCRHRARIDRRNPRKLWNRKCAKCSEPIATSFSPERPETVLCEKCYLNAVY